MELEKVLFISNQKFLDEKQNEGGVRVCTLEFIHLLQERFEVVLFPVDYRFTLMKRVKLKAGLSIYDHYEVNDYRERLTAVIRDQKIKYVFLNLTNTMRFASVIKELPVDGVRVILCSHGNETGDYLHEIVRFGQQQHFLKRLLSSYVLGNLLKLESAYRLQYIDMVLSVSPVEEQIERWLGIGQTFMVPRTVDYKPLAHKPVPGRVGFIGDLSHWPNRFGITELFTELSRFQHKVVVRLVGAPEGIGRELEKRFPFVEYLGFLPEAELEKEMASWAFFLNPVFYYSRGVSTKLAKALGRGIPVVSTIPGNRGYRWTKGGLLTAENAAGMAKLVVEYACDLSLIETARAQAVDAAQSSPSLSEIMKELYPVIKQL